jgi:hypothetical protein
MKYATIFALLLVATTLEASGDAIVRVGLNTAATPMRIVLMLAGAATLLRPDPPSRPARFRPLDRGVCGDIFFVAQIINLVVFRTAPSLPIGKRPLRPTALWN